MLDWNFAGGEGVGYEGAVAAPGNGFCAHESAGFLFGEDDGAPEGCFEFGGLHVVGVAAETRVAPACVDGIFFGMAEATESFEMDVADFVGVEGG